MIISPGHVTKLISYFCKCAKQRGAKPIFFIKQKIATWILSARVGRFKNKNVGSCGQEWLGRVFWGTTNQSKSFSNISLTNQNALPG